MFFQLTNTKSKRIDYGHWVLVVIVFCICSARELPAQEIDLGWRKPSLSSHITPVRPGIGNRDKQLEATASALPLQVDRTISLPPVTVPFQNASPNTTVTSWPMRGASFQIGPSSYATSELSDSPQSNLIPDNTLKPVSLPPTGNTSASTAISAASPTTSYGLLNGANAQSTPSVNQTQAAHSGVRTEPSGFCGPGVMPESVADFLPTPLPQDTYNPELDQFTYFGKTAIPVQRPWVEFWRPFYTGGMYDPSIPVFSDVNPLTPHFLVYGDYRAAVGVHRNKGQPVRSMANRLNLDMDLRLTGTERFHAFFGPLDHNGQFTRLDFSDSRNVRFEEKLDFQPDTAFFEGDLGAMTGGLTGVDAPFDLPFTMGKVPLLYQNGIWMEDAIAGFAFGFPWRHNRSLNWSNYEATFFAGFEDVTSPAFQNNKSAAQVFGTAWFVEAYNGYIEADYAFLNDIDDLNRSYHNLAFAYTRRYFSCISNTVRVIGNVGQQGPRVQRSADGFLLIVENSLITYAPSTVVPYYNTFFGYGTPQSVARAAGAGGILRNTGINFESDNLTGYPTLDATASNSYGGALGINFLTADFRKQWAFEFAALDTYGDGALSKAAGAQYGIGTRWQKALNNWTLVRLDLMQGWFDKAPDIYGMRAEFRWKF